MRQISPQLCKEPAMNVRNVLLSAPTDPAKCPNVMEVFIHLMDLIHAQAYVTFGMEIQPTEAKDALVEAVNQRVADYARYIDGFLREHA